MYKLNKLYLIVIYGRQGAGKSTLADFLYSKLSYTAHIGVDKIKRFISEFREIPTHDFVSRKVINTMAEEYLKNNISVIVEQGMSKEDIENLEKIAGAQKANFLVYRLEADEKILTERIQERTIRLNKPQITQEDLDEKSKIFNENDYPSTRIIDSGLLGTEEKANLILKDLDVL